MDYWYQWTFFGMHFFWWLFWVALIAALFSLATPMSRRRRRELEDPLTILQRTFASGQITQEEYERRRDILRKDRGEEQTSAARGSQEGRRRSDTCSRQHQRP